MFLLHANMLTTISLGTSHLYTHCKRYFMYTSVNSEIKSIGLHTLGKYYAQVPIRKEPQRGGLSQVVRTDMDIRKHHGRTKNCSYGQMP